MKNKFRIYDAQNRLMIHWEKLKHHPHLWQMISGKMVGLIPCAFTGLKDKNGVEIYEGDVLLDPETDEEGNDISGKHPVVYCFDTASFCVDNSFKKDGSHTWNMVSYLGIDNLEVIGNIHENPELT